MEPVLDRTLASPTIAAGVTQDPIRSWKKYSLQGKWTMMGYSRAADRTFFYVPELRMGLDAGGCRGRQPDFVFVTHSHIDHSVDLWYMAQREGTKIFIPAESQPFIERAVVSQWEMNLCAALDSTPTLPFQPVRPGDEFPWGKKDAYRVKVFACFHKVPSVGYAFHETRYRLKEAYRGQSGKEIAAARKAGTEVNEEYVNLMFAFLGDTDTRVFEVHPWLFDYPVIIVECTFFQDEQERALDNGHVHWDALAPHILAHPGVTFVLIHFSMRYKEQEVYDFFHNLSQRETEPLNLSNVVLIVNDASEGRE